MKTNAIILWSELLLLFVIIPLSLATPIATSTKTSFVIAAVLYCGVISHQTGLITRHTLLTLGTKADWRNITLRFGAFALLSTAVMAVFLPERLFAVVLHNPQLWISISLFYSLFSVLPQEFLYRTFFFKRYGSLIKSTTLFVLLNALLFSLAHVMFANPLVYLLTFIGGILFARTHLQTNSLTLVCLEHAAYGVWLFTLGIGHLLAFPG